MARKREEKSGQNSGSNNGQKSRAAPENSAKDKNFASLKQQLVSMKLTLREIPGDGNCLFGALADQLDGTPKTHQKHRHEVVSYMRSHREDFEPFVEDDIPFERHLSNLAELGTYGGNECIVAFARLNKVKVVIHQLNAPLWQIDGSEGQDNARELHISYHNGDHYNSVRRTGDCTANPTNIKLTTMKNSCSGENLHKRSSSTNRKQGGYEYEDSCNINCDDSDGMVSCSDDDVNFIMERTGYDDADIVKHFLVSSDYDVREAISALLKYIVLEHKGENSCTVPNGIAVSRNIREDLNDSDVSSQAVSMRERKSPQEKIQEKLKSTTHVSNSKRKDLKKQLRKQQAMERKKQQTHCEEDSIENSDDSSETILVKDLGCLSI